MCSHWPSISKSQAPLLLFCMKPTDWKKDTIETTVIKILLVTEDVKELLDVTWTMYKTFLWTWWDCYTWCTSKRLQVHLWFSTCSWEICWTPRWTLFSVRGMASEDVSAFDPKEVKEKKCKTDSPSVCHTTLFRCFHVLTDLYCSILSKCVCEKPKCVLCCGTTMQYVVKKKRKVGLIAFL